MPLNNLEFRTRFTDELDKMYVQKSVTGFFADNNMRNKFVGAKTVLIPDVDFQGLADYDRDNGFTRGAITVANTPYTMDMDRARSMHIDREDLDETGVSNLAGQVLGEFVRTKVVPECDAYILSKLAGLAISRSNLIEGAMNKPYEALCTLINEVQNNVGYDEELIAFIDSRMFAKLQNTTEISRMITVSDFKQGEINLKVKSINGVSLLPVPSSRLFTAYDFLNDSTGGFKPLDTARSTYMLVMPKKFAHLVKKTEKIRVFEPDKNIDADAYKFDYRIYYDVFVKKSELDGIWGWVSPTVSITSQPTDATVTAGSISGSLSVIASSSATLTYQWYECDENGNNAVKVSGAKSASYTIPTDLTEGEYHYFVKVIANGIAEMSSDIVTVTVE